MQKDKVVYPYIPNTVPEIRKRMMKEVGVDNIMEIYDTIPDELLFKGKMNLPEPIMDEYSIRRHVEGILNKNKNCKEYLNFLGAGCAQHYVPAVCDEIISRGELLTAYGAEAWADHGKHQIIFEYVSMMAELVDMDIVSWSFYDGIQTINSSICLAARITGRNKVIIPKSMNPETLSAVKNYLRGLHEGEGIEIILINYIQETGQMDLEDLKKKISSDVAAVLIENPSYLGFVDSHAKEIGSIAKEAGAEFIVYTDPIALGVMEAPANYGATITCGDFHTLGLHLGAGGCQGGFIATHDDDRYISQFKDLMYGLSETVVEGEFGFTPVLSERTSYAVREKGREFTGTGTNLWAMNVAVYLSLMGPQGMQEVGATIMKNAQYAAQEIAKIPGIEIKIKSPFFKEFVVNFDETGKSVAEINKKLLDNKIFGGKNIFWEFPELGQSALFCVTEVHTKEDIDKLVQNLQVAIRS